MNVLKRAYDEFWDVSHWLPPGYNWSSLKSTEFEQYPQFSDLRLPIYYALIVLIIRMLFEWGIARPLGRFMGIKNATSALPNIFYRLFCLLRQFWNEPKICMINNGCYNSGSSNTNNNNNNITAATSSNSVELQRRHSTTLVPKSTLDKFAECSWRFAFYFFIFNYGLYTLWSKDYFWDTTHCWFDYPLQPITSDLYWYYMMEMSFYWSLIMSQFFDVHRKDFWVNFVHHIATVLLMGFSWSVNFVRIGTLVLLTHDAADSWLEATKMTRYCKKIAICNTLFVIFSVIWIVTRCVYFPFWIIYSTLIEGVVLVGFYEAYYVFNFLLILLFILHLFWTYLILKIFVSTCKSGQMDDARSDSEDEGEELNEREHDQENITSNNVTVQDKKED